MMRTLIEAIADMKRGSLMPYDIYGECIIQSIKLAGLKALVQDNKGMLDKLLSNEQSTVRKHIQKILSANDPSENLFGIPIGIKDIFEVAGLPNRGGSQRWGTPKAERNATVVKRLKEAGAYVIGKTATTPYAVFDPSVTLNPWNKDRTPGGSSSGSAVAVATGMCLAAIGSQTGGSTIRPAAYCGVVGFKPSYGKVSLKGVLPLAPSLDHVGIFARCVADANIIFAAIVDSPITPTAKKPARIARLGGFFQKYAEPEMAEAFDAFCTAHRYCEIVDPEPDFDLLLKLHRTIMAYECAQIHAARLAVDPDDYPPKVTGLIQEGMAVPASDHKAALARRAEFRQNVRIDVSRYDLPLPRDHRPGTGTFPPRVRRSSSRCGAISAFRRSPCRSPGPRTTCRWGCNWSLRRTTMRNSCAPPPKSKEHYRQPHTRSLEYRFSGEYMPNPKQKVFSTDRRGSIQNPFDLQSMVLVLSMFHPRLKLVF